MVSHRHLTAHVLANCWHLQTHVFESVQESTCIHRAWSCIMCEAVLFHPTLCASASNHHRHESNSHFEFVLHWYAQVISAVAPRPIGFVSTQSAAGVVNLSPYSFFNVMSHNPCTVTLGVGRSIPRGGVKKDTLTNIEETKWVASNGDGCGQAAHDAGTFQKFHIENVAQTQIPKGGVMRFIKADWSSDPWSNHCGMNDLRASFLQFSMEHLCCCLFVFNSRGRIWYFVSCVRLFSEEGWAEGFFHQNMAGLSSHRADT